MICWLTYLFAFLYISQPLSLLPLSLWSWQDAVKAIFSGKVTVVDVYPDVTIRAASLEIPLPSVIALNEYVPKSRHTPAFTRRNVFLRDEYKCQYCRERFHTNDLSLDHVVPRCKGGVLSWYVVASLPKVCSKETKPMDPLVTRTYTHIVLFIFYLSGQMR